MRYYVVLYCIVLSCVVLYDMRHENIICGLREEEVSKNQPIKRESDDGNLKCHLCPMIRRHG